MIFQLDAMHNLPTKLPKKLLDEKLVLFFVEANPKSSKHHKMPPSTLLGWIKLKPN
jgi:hypothetical protein